MGTFVDIFMFAVSQCPFKVGGFQATIINGFKHIYAINIFLFIVLKFFSILRIIKTLEELSKKNVYQKILDLSVTK